MRWLLPVLVVRAFLPVGFMFTTDADGLHLAFCPDQAPIVHSLHDAPPAGHAGHHGAGHIDPPCPFAMAAVAAVIDVPHLETVALRTVDPFVPERIVAVPLAGPQRADRIRGPPVLS